MARQYCVVCDDTGCVCYTGDYEACQVALRTLIEDDYDHYSIELKEV